MSTREKWEFAHPDGWKINFEVNDGAVDVSPEAILELYQRRTVGLDAPEGEIGMLTVDAEMLMDWLEELGYE